MSGAVTPKELFELAQTSTVDMFGPLPYDEAGFKEIYGISFSVELMDFISATGYYEGVSAGRQWSVPMQEVIDFPIRIQRESFSLPILRNTQLSQKKSCKHFPQIVCSSIQLLKVAMIYSAVYTH